MRKEPSVDERALEANGDSVGYTFFFQIANDGQRRACRVKVDALNMQEASLLFREKWPVIEEMARDGIRANVGSDDVISLVMP